MDVEVRFVIRGGGNGPVIGSLMEGREIPARTWSAGCRLYRVAAFGARLEPGLQAGLDEFVQVAVQHLLRVAALDAGAQVLDPRLWSST